MSYFLDVDYFFHLNCLQVNHVVLNDLTRDRNYEIVVVPFNSQGSGPASPPVAVYVGEAVPTGKPRNVEAEPVSSTEVRLRWHPPQQSQQNGDLLGYKVCFLVKNELNSFVFYPYLINIIT